MFSASTWCLYEVTCAIQSHQPFVPLSSAADTLYICHQPRNVLYTVATTYPDSAAAEAGFIIDAVIFVNLQVWHFALSNVSKADCKESFHAPSARTWSGFAAKSTFAFGPFLCHSISIAQGFDKQLFSDIFQVCWSSLKHVQLLQFSVNCITVMWVQQIMFRAFARCLYEVTWAIKSHQHVVLSSSSSDTLYICHQLRNFLFNFATTHPESAVVEGGFTIDAMLCVSLRLGCRKGITLFHNAGLLRFSAEGISAPCLRQLVHGNFLRLCEETASTIFEDPFYAAHQVLSFVQHCTFACLLYISCYPWRPKLACGVRHGEAKNPGPSKQVNECNFFNVGLCNPTSIYNKADTIKQLFTDVNLHILCLAETSATTSTQSIIRSNLRPEGIKCLFSPEVPPQITRVTGEPSNRGKASGTAVFSTTPCRLNANPRPTEWITSPRFCHSICQLGPLQCQVVSIYGMTASHATAADFTNQMLEAILHEVKLVGLPFLIAGDFNHEPQKLPIWDDFAAWGCQDLLELHQAKFHCEMPPTCLEVTRPDNCILSKELIPLLTHIQVLEATWFATHRPVTMSFSLPKCQLFKNVLRLPKTWIELGIEKSDLEKTETTVDTWPWPQTLEEWGHQVEQAVDLALRLQPQKDDGQPGHLPKAYRGRMQPRAPVKVPLQSHVKPARQGDYNPEKEVCSVASGRCVKQLRRIQSLYRRFKKVRS